MAQRRWPEMAAQRLHDSGPHWSTLTSAADRLAPPTFRAIELNLKLCSPHCSSEDFSMPRGCLALKQWLEREVPRKHRHRLFLQPQRIVLSDRPVERPSQRFAVPVPALVPAKAGHNQYSQLHSTVDTAGILPCTTWALSEPTRIPRTRHLIRSDIHGDVLREISPQDGADAVSPMAHTSGSHVFIKTLPDQSAAVMMRTPGQRAYPTR